MNEDIKRELEKDMEKHKQGWISNIISEGDESIRRELDDYYETIKVYSKVLDRVTNGKMSKVNYTWKAISEVLDEIAETTETSEGKK